MPKIRIAAVCRVAVVVGALAATPSLDAQQPSQFRIEQIAKFQVPWALEFLPDGRLLISEGVGALKLLNADGTIGEITGVPAVSFGGQGGLGDIVLSPEYASNGVIYVSYVEAGPNDTSGAVVARGRLELKGPGGALVGLEPIWRQVPKVSGQGHFSHRIALRDGYLWISSGDRQQFDPAQDMQSNLGKILRLNMDGSVPRDNPFAAQGGVTAQIWTLGHRNPLGLAFDGQGRLWSVEMGPMGGDELNLIRRGQNYGYPIVSNGDHYDGKPIPDHHTRPEFAAPAIWWNPVISPSSLMFYKGSEFPAWRGDAFITGLSSQALVRIEFDGETAREAERIDMGRRIRALEEGPDGVLWALEDGRPGRGGNGWLLKLTSPR